MKIVYKKIDELKPYENNPRINDEAVEYVAKSIKEFGFKVPIVLDKDNVIVAYIPKKVENGYQVIGLSKIPRIVEMCSKRLQLQEKLASDISECISIATGSDDVYVNIIGDHACVSARGAKSDGFTDVTYLTGRFKTNSDLRGEIERKIK